MRKLRKIFLAFAFLVVLALSLQAAGEALAQAQPVDTGLNFATGTGLVAQNPKATAVKVIRIGLGFLGVIALGLIIYAGFLWMSAKGNEEKIEQAKKILIGAAIGFVIILSAFGIASFILSKLLGATGGGGSGGVCSPACSSNQTCCNGQCISGACGVFGSGDVFGVRGVTPAHQAVDVPRNSVVRVQFTKNVNPSSVTSNTFTISRPGGKRVNGDRKSEGSIIEFAPSSPCEAPNASLKCFPKNEVITIEVKNKGMIATANSSELATIMDSDEKGGIISVNSEQLNCSTAKPCLFTFTTGDYIDTKAPRVNLTTAQVCISADNNLQASAVDDRGVSKIDFFAGNQLIGSLLNNSFPFVPSPYSASLVWNPGAGTVGQTIALKATAYDLDSNSASAEKTLRLSATHCCNGLQDGDETGVDCGGSCLACVGQACSVANSEPPVCSSDLCSSAFCSATGSPTGDCLCQAHPRIDWVSPAGGFCANDANKSCSADSDCGSNVRCDTGTPNGSGGNLVTISGQGFGTAIGKVYFSAPGGRQIEAVLANDPDGGNPKCGDRVWSSTEIIAVVPAGAADGPISIETKAGAADATDDSFGSLINDFKKNTINRPGLCLVNPFKGRAEDIVNYSGLKLAAAKAYFGNAGQSVEALGSEFGQADSGRAGVPNLVEGQTSTYVLTNRIASNYLAFTKDREPYDGPVIRSIDPTSGPIGQYVTIQGTGFGAARGTSKVFFGDMNGKEADYSFPEICSDSVWNDRQIIVKVPAGITAAAYKLTIVRSPYPPVDSGSTTFQVTIGAPAPGLCRISPVRGKGDSSVTFWGEYFQNKDANSSISFTGATQPQSGAAITAWDIDQSATGIKPWRAITTVPQSAVTGPVRVNAGTPVRASNGLIFSVGACSQDADCGSGATCCSAGLPEAGKCKNDAAQCYGSAETSVYEWQFSTGTVGPTCQPDQPNICGSVCCSGRCADPLTSTCEGCKPLQNKCGNGKCCNQACVTPPGSHTSTCPDPNSCSGYNNNLCLENYFCPNSAAGHCSPDDEEKTCKCCCNKLENDKETGENPACCAGNGLTCANTCGAGGDMGVCAGCAPSGVPDENSDAKCNCTTTSGMFCAVNTTNPTGYCADCASITDPAECSSHAQCCVDGRPGQGGKCIGVVTGQPRIPSTPTLGGDIFAKVNSAITSAPGGPATLQYCGFFSCKGSGGVNACNDKPAKEGTYPLLSECTTDCANQPIPCSTLNNCAEPKCEGDAHCDMGSCTCKPNAQGPQDPCKNPLTQKCTISCTAGYECRTPYANSGSTAAAGNETPDDTCRCCCKPPTTADPTDTCKDLDSSLSCLADQDACDGPNRGACCGCTKDAQCGDTATTGCGQTGSDCCRQRPRLKENYPASGATNVCRNPSIEAIFDQQMDLSRFTGNVLLVGDYGGGACPSNYTPIVLGQPTTRLAKILNPFKKLVARFAPIFLTKNAVADASTYCIVNGSPLGQNVNSLSSKVTYRLTKTLDPNRRYFVVLQGDPDLASLPPNDEQKQYYDSKIRSLSKIGFMSAPGRLPPDVPSSFGTTVYPNAQIWTFKTGADICTIDGVSVSPSYYLFQKPGEANGKILNASAMSRGQRIYPIAGVYDWLWEWSTANADVVRLDPVTDQPSTVMAIAGNKKDAQTTAQATVTITADSEGNTVGRKVQGNSQLRVFLCENPWPVYIGFMPPPGYVWPWRDETTGIEFYYCRDANGPGTSDDLPAIKDAPLTPTSGRRVCMIGANHGKACTSDTDCAVVGSCWPELLKEYFFFRDTEPGKPTITGSVEPEGGKVTLRWTATQYATKYKVYYGKSRGQYTNTIDVPGSVTEITKVISGLVNNVRYYFAVTALSEKNQETEYSNEISLTPLDTIAPDKPNIIGSGGEGGGTPQNNGQVALFWEPVPEAATYIAYLGTRPRGQNEEYASNQVVTGSPSASVPDAIFGGLDPTKTYYFAVRSVDMYGNKSDYSPEITVRPNQPHLLPVESSRAGVTLRWLPFNRAQGYVITVSQGGGRTIPPISVPANKIEHVLTGLTRGTYKFTVTAKKSGTAMSESSNEETVTIN